MEISETEQARWVGRIWATSTLIINSILDACSIRADIVLKNQTLVYQFWEVKLQPFHSLAQFQVWEFWKRGTYETESIYKQAKYALQLLGGEKRNRTNVSGCKNV